MTSTRGELQLPGCAYLRNLTMLISMHFHTVHNYNRHAQPTSAPIPHSHAVRSPGLALWSKLALLEPEKTEQYLFYLGFTNAHDGTGRHRCFRPEISPGRSVLRCCVVGAQGVGKSAVMRSLAQKLWLPNHSSPKAPLIKHAVTTNCGHDKLASWVRAGATLKQPSTFLVLTEVPTGTEAEFFADDELVCDVVLLLFDARQADSLAHINTVVNTCVPHFIPCVCVNNKSDLLPKKGSSSKSGAIDVVLASARTFCKRNGIAGKRSTQQEFPYMNAVGSAKDARKLYKTLVLYGKNPKSLCRKPRKDRCAFVLSLFLSFRFRFFIVSPISDIHLILILWATSKSIIFVFVAMVSLTQQRRWQALRRAESPWLLLAGICGHLPKRKKKLTVSQ